LKQRPVGPVTTNVREIRELIVVSALPDKVKQVREIFEKQPFGELERLVTQKAFGRDQESRPKKN